MGWVPAFQGTPTVAAVRPSSASYTGPARLGGRTPQRPNYRAKKPLAVWPGGQRLTHACDRHSHVIGRSPLLPSLNQPTAGGCQRGELASAPDLRVVQDTVNPVAAYDTEIPRLEPKSSSLTVPSDVTTTFSGFK